MGKKAVKKYFSAVILTITIFLFVIILVGLYGGEVSPEGNTLRATATMLLPIFVALNLLTLLYWAIRRSWFVLIPLVSMACSYRYVGTIFQFGSKPEDVKYDLAVATYNVHRFNRDATGIVSMEVVNTLQRQGADIICMQEFDNAASGDVRTVLEKCKELYPHQVLSKDLAILSRYPIKESKAMPFEFSNNGALWADVQVSKEHLICVFNVHMETTGISGNLHQAAKAAAGQGGTKIDMMMQEEVRGRLADSYVFNGIVRGGQAVQIANEKHNTPHPIILCGDFNDVPYSYTYLTLLGQLKDGFREGGHGFASTYNGAKGLMRIDYIFHSEGMKSVDYYTLDAEYSDHKPVISKITFHSEAQE